MPTLTFPQMNSESVLGSGCVGYPPALSPVDTCGQTNDSNIVWLCIYEEPLIGLQLLSSVCLPSASFGLHSHSQACAYLRHKYGVH